MIADLNRAFELRSNKVNKIENTKNLKHPLEAWEKLQEYAKNGYDSISAEDKGYFLKCFGIFDRPATPKQFMLRVRIPGGQLTHEQAEVIGKISCDYGEDYIDLTTRMQVELRYLEIENMPTILNELKRVGITSYQTGVDNFRNILNDPLDGAGVDNILPSQSLLLKLQDKFLHNKDWISALPRKFNTAISGSIANRCNVFGHDCCFVLAQKDGVYGYNLYLGGKVGKVAKNANIFLKDEDEVLIAYGAIMELFRDNGFRDNRNKNRLFFLIESVGIQKFAEAIREKASVEFATAGETLTLMENFDPKHGRIQLKQDGELSKSYAMHVVIPSGIFSGKDMVAIAKAAENFGDGNIRLDVEQSLYVTGVKDGDIEQFLGLEFFEKYKNVNTPYFNNMIACAGIEHCPFGVIANKPDAIEMSKYLSENVALNDGMVRMYWSACIKGCGINGVGDIGFEGCKAKLNGELVHAVNITIGGKLTSQGAEGYSVLRSAPLLYAKYYVESLMLEYKRLKHIGESFEKFHDRILLQYSRAFLGFMMVVNAYLRRKNIGFQVELTDCVTTNRYEKFELFETGRVLYNKLMNEEPYGIYDGFAPAPRQKLKPLRTINSAVDEVLADTIYKMIHPNKEERAVVFSELQGDLL